MIIQNTAEFLSRLKRKMKGLWCDSTINVLIQTFLHGWQNTCAQTSTLHPCSCSQNFVSFGFFLSCFPSVVLFLLQLVIFSLLVTIFQNNVKTNLFFSLSNKPFILTSQKVGRTCFYLPPTASILAMLLITCLSVLISKME